MVHFNYVNFQSAPVVKAYFFSAQTFNFELTRNQKPIIIPYIEIMHAE